MHAGDYHDPYAASMWSGGPGDEHKPGLGMAVAAGVGATAVVMTAMYFMSGREMPKLPTFGQTEKLVEREALFGRDE